MGSLKILNIYVAIVLGSPDLYISHVVVDFNVAPLYY